MGVDAGATTAFAVIDYEGKVVALESRRNWVKSDFIKCLSVFSPAIIACDTKPPLKLTRFLARLFSAKLFYPTHSLKELEKISIAKKFKYKNKHERDALAAASKAFSHYSNKLRQVEKKMKGSASQKMLKAKALVLKGKRMSEACLS